MKANIDGYEVVLQPVYGRPVANVVRAYGYAARVVSDPSGAEFYGETAVDAKKAAGARIYELRVAARIEQELAVKSPLEGMRA